MQVSIIVAVEAQRGIGRGNQIPWRLSADLKRFKTLTMGHYLIVGRRTYESIGRPLPGRHMVVITRQLNYSAPGCTTAHSLQLGLDLAKAAGETEVFIGGGAGIYAEALPLAGRIYLTRVHAAVEADTFFPPINPADWTETLVAHHPADEHNEFPFTFLELDRRSETLE
jgi:dihydrofolate reductase